LILKGDLFLRESQNQIHLPTIISESNKLSIILVSDAKKFAYVSEFLITSAARLAYLFVNRNLPFS